MLMLNISLIEFLKGLEVVGLSLLTRLCSIGWRSMPASWQIGTVVPLFKKGGLEGVSQPEGAHTFQTLWERL